MLYFQGCFVGAKILTAYDLLNHIFDSGSLIAICYSPVLYLIGGLNPYSIPLTPKSKLQASNWQLSRSLQIAKLMTVCRILGHGDNLRSYTNIRE